MKTLPKRRLFRTQPYRKPHQDFIAAWLRSPLKVGAIIPSSRTLAKVLAAQVDIDEPGLVIDLGAGTGVMTQALLEAGVDPVQMVMVEREQRLHLVLQSQFPGVHAICDDATNLHRIIEQMGHPKVKAIISSLPMLSLPRATKNEIQKQMIELVGEDGVIVQFTYGRKSPLSPRVLHAYGVVGRRVKSVLTNVPPAHVWVYKKG
ncbi:MAG: class I SAM-dependent methyltransferase [Rickettsiales bacterium]